MRIVNDDRQQQQQQQWQRRPNDFFSELMKITYARHVIVSARLMNGK